MDSSPFFLLVAGGGGEGLQWPWLSPEWKGLLVPNAQVRLSRRRAMTSRYGGMRPPRGPAQLYPLPHHTCWGCRDCIVLVPC